MSSPKVVTVRAGRPAVPCSQAPWILWLRVSARVVRALGAHDRSGGSDAECRGGASKWFPMTPPLVEPMSLASQSLQLWPEVRTEDDRSAPAACAHRRDFLPSAAGHCPLLGQAEPGSYAPRTFRAIAQHRSESVFGVVHNVEGVMLLKRNANSQLGVESLESRINLAAVSLSVNDGDGDIVRITASVPGAARPPLDITDVVLFSGGIAELKVTEQGFENATIRITAKANLGGDGQVRVASIDAAGRNLNRVVVGGALQEINAGSVTPNGGFSGVKVLKVRSMGFAGGLGPLGVSVITGSLRVLQVAGDIQNASLRVLPAAPSRPAVLGKAFIGGDIIGGAGFASGTITADAIRTLRVGGDIRGGNGEQSGSVRVGGTGISGFIGNVRVGGSLIGGGGQGSGQILGQTIRTLVIQGNVTGGDGLASGRIVLAVALNETTRRVGRLRIAGNIAGGSGEGSGVVDATFAGVIHVGGSVLGGAGNRSGNVSVATAASVTVGGDVIGNADNSGSITGFSRIESLVVSGDVIGGSITGSASKSDAGRISAGGLGRVVIEGSLIAGTDTSTGELVRCGAVTSIFGIGSLRVGGDVRGTSGQPALIASARGRSPDKPASGFEVAIGEIKVGGNVQFASIVAGFRSTPFSLSAANSLVPDDADASIGKVEVAGGWESSDLVAGCIDLGPPGFGIGDEVQTADDTPLIARIASIVIGGTVVGSTQGGDHFGFVAQQIEKVRIGSQGVALNAGQSNDNVLVQGTTDVRVLEVP